MCDKGYLISLFRRSILHLKNLRVSFFIPIFLMDVLLPVLLINSYKINGISERFLVDTKHYCFMILPASSICWSTLVMKDYVGEIGSEVLYVNSNKIKLFDFLLIFFYALVNIFIIALVLWHLIKEALPIFIAIALIDIFLFGLSYSLLFYTKSLTIVIMTEIIYIIISLIIDGRYTIFPFYATNDRITSSNLSFYLFIGFIGIILTIIGVCLNKRKCI